MVLYALVLALAVDVLALEITSLGQKIAVEKVASGFGIPWGFDFLPGKEGELLVAEKHGAMSVVSGGEKKGVSGLPEVDGYGQGGLMDVRFHPDASGRIFFTYVSRYEGGRGTVLAGARLDATALKDVKILFRSSPPGSGGRHFGSRIAFGRDGSLFFGVGDRGDRDKAQDLDYPNGKIFRIRTDGTVAEDNPFKDRPLAAVWSYGHRNPQGMAIHPATGRLWQQEHGPRGGDEINRIVKGANYGWPVATYGKEYWGPPIAPSHKEGTEGPVKYYVPSIAPSSLMIYSGKLFKKWRHHFFSAALKSRHINRIAIDAGGNVGPEERLLEGLRQRVRHLMEAPSGEIYFSTDAGNIYRMSLVRGQN